MPYPFAHPAAVLPLTRLMGRFGVPSALVIGSIAPDLWYLVPPLAREHGHSVAGLLGFCLPAGLFAYLVFHVLLKQPLLALLPPALASRLAATVTEGLPRVPWAAVLASLLAGAATHLLWDAATHETYVVHGFQVLQHASTLLGTTILAVWLQRWMRRAAPRELPSGFLLSPPVRRGTLALFIIFSVAWVCCVATTEALALPQDVTELRQALRTTGSAAVQALALSTIGYAMLWKVLR